jgi:hypothetical protein
MMFAVVIVLWIARFQPRGLYWFLPPVLFGLAAVLGYNFWFFGELTGGQAELEQIHRSLHRLPGPWSGNLVEGALGTLFSPNRGLFVFSPWIALALATTPFVAQQLRAGWLVSWLLPVLALYLLVLSKYSVWWGGHCFGPRYWTDVIPLFAVLLALGLEWAATRSRAAIAFFLSAIALSVGTQCIGAFCFPSTWNLKPLNVDFHHERLWDWKDTELSRCISEAMKQHKS